jgi:hypothetical protein
VHAVDGNHANRHDANRHCHDDDADHHDGHDTHRNNDNADRHHYDTCNHAVDDGY